MKTKYMLFYLKKLKLGICYLTICESFGKLKQISNCIPELYRQKIIHLKS